jgi:capsular exopolysaccharide synthesis family protein
MTSERTEEEWREEEISIGDLVGTLKRRKGTLAWSTFVCLGLAAGVTLKMAPTYSSEARVLIEEPASMSSMLGRLANLPIDLMGMASGSPQTAAEMEILQSRTVVSAVVGPKGTSSLVPEEGMARTALVDDLEQQSLWAKLNRSFHQLEPIEGGLSVAVERWDFPKSSSDPLLITFEGQDLVRVSIDRWFDKREQVLTLSAGGALEYEEATLTLVSDGDIVGRKFRLSVSELPIAVNSFLEELVVEETDRGSNVLRIAFPDRDAERAASTVNALLRSYLAHNRDRFARRTNRSVEFVKIELERVSGELKIAEEELEQFALVAGNMVLPETAIALVEKLVEVDLERAKSAMTSVTLKGMLEQIESGSLSLEEIAGLEGVKITPENTHVVHKPLSELLAQKRVMEFEYNDEWPALRDLNAQIEDRTASFQAVLKSDIWKQDRLTGELESILGRYESELNSLPTVQLQLARHTMRVQAFTEIYLFLVGQLEESRIARTSTVPNVEVIDWAVPANEPDSPSIPLNVALGLALGLFLGASIASVREATERPIVSSSQLERISGNPCLLTVSKDKLESVDADSHRALRASVMHLAKEEGTKTLAIVSSGANESTPATSLGLARALAQSGERVLLIEGDLSAPSLATALGVTTSSGLIDVLEGKITAEAAISESEVENLSLLSASSSSAASGDLLGSLRLRETLKSLGASYDRVLITTPDLSNNSDAISVAAASDSSLWLVQAGQVSEDAITESCKHMHMAGASILGCVLKTS